MMLPKDWDERQISLDIKRYSGDKGLLSRYFDGIISRFVSGQEAQTIAARAKFLDTFNQFAAIQRQSYKWHRYMQGDRAEHEEDLADVQAEIQLAKAKAELEGVGGDEELAKLEREAKHLQAKIAIAQKEKELKEINTPPPTVAPSRPILTTAELRERDKAALAESEKRIREAIAITEADPTLHEDQKRRKLNLLEERLAEIYEKQVKLL